MKGFRNVSYISSSFPKLFMAQGQALEVVIDKEEDGEGGRDPSVSAVRLRSLVINE
jgi:hypothetical protein